MKNLLLSIFTIIVFSGSIQANNILDEDTTLTKEISVDLFEEINLKKDVTEILTITKIFVMKDDGTCSILYSVRRQDGSEISSFRLEAPDTHPDCWGVVFHISPF